MKKERTDNKGKTADKTVMTPRRAALVLLFDWMSMGSASPWFMDAEEMTERLSAHNYRVTEKRRDEIIRFAEKLTDPLKERISETLQKEGIDSGW